MLSYWRSGPRISKVMDTWVLADVPFMAEVVRDRSTPTEKWYFHCSTFNFNKQELSKFTPDLACTEALQLLQNRIYDYTWAMLGKKEIYGLPITLNLTVPLPCRVDKLKDIDDDDDAAAEKNKKPLQGDVKVKVKHRRRRRSYDLTDEDIPVSQFIL